MNEKSVTDRLIFAKRRLTDLEGLARNGEDLGGADPDERQQLIQEFFFHIGGAIEFLAQLVNTSKALGIAVEEVSVPKVCGKIDNIDLKKILGELHPKTRGELLPTDPYSEDGCHFRILRYRNRVCHHGHNPFHFRVYLGSSNLKPPTSLYLDPINQSLGSSDKSAIEELNRFYDLVEYKCQRILAML